MKKTIFMKRIVFIFLLLFTFITNFGFVVNAEFVLPPDEGGGTSFTEGILTIYSDGTTNSSGSSSASFIPLLAGTHSFIYFHNIGNTSVNLGVYNVLPNQSVSIGIYGNKIDNLGVWYNLEQYFYDEVGAYSNAVSLNTIANENDIEILDEYIDNHNTWTNSYNCSSFASEAWNLVSDINLDPYNDILFVDTPKKLSNSIKDVSGYFTGIQFTVVSNIDDYVGYYGYDSNNNGVFIEQLPS